MRCALEDCDDVTIVRTCVSLRVIGKNAFKAASQPPPYNQEVVSVGLGQLARG